MDCPDRERGGWLCDCLWTARAASLMLGDHRVEREMLETFLVTDPDEMFCGFFPEVYPASKENFRALTGITTWSFWFMCQLCEYVDRTGDMALAREFDLCKRIIFTGQCNGDRALALSLGGDMWRSMWPGHEIADGIAANKQDGSPFLNVAYCMITPENNKELCESGFGFSAWTVEKEYFLRLFLKMGISNITTTRPVLAMKLRKEIQGI